MRKWLFLFLAFTVAAAAQAGQNVVGSVLNLTTGTPLAHTKVTLVQLQGNMNNVGETTTDATGHYRFSENISGPFMVRVDYQGVPYFAKVTKGQGETNVSVYNVSNDPKLLHVDAEIMVLQPDQGQLAVVNEYRIENGLQPMRTLAAKGGMFRFRVAPGAHVDMVRVQAPNEMPLARTPLPTADHNVYSVDTPLRPGETQIQISYRVPYAVAKTTVTETPVVPPSHFEVYVPQPMQFSGTGFVQVGAQQGYNVYGMTTAAVPQTVSFNVSGTAPLPQEVASGDAGAGAGAAGSAGSNGAAAGSGAGPEAAAAPTPATAVGAVPMPTLLERNKWTIFIVLALCAAAGFGILLSRSEKPEAAAAAGAPAVRVPAAAAPPADDDLARLKDDLFLLEVRHHTGNISEADYASARAALDLRMSQLAGR